MPFSLKKVYQVVNIKKEPTDFQRQTTVGSQEYVIFQILLQAVHTFALK